MDSLLRSSLIKAARRLAAVAFAIGLAACAVAQAIGTEIIVPAGAVNRGSALFQPEEAVGGQGTVAAFAIDATEVTDEQFDAFVRETGYVTRAERLDETGIRYGAAVFDREPKDVAAPHHPLDCANRREAFFRSVTTRKTASPARPLSDVFRQTLSALTT